MTSSVPELTPIRFGTDGWRAIIADEFTFHNLERVAQAFADYLRKNAEASTNPKVVVGYDRRFLSEQFAVRAAEVLNANDIRVSIFPTDVPTPVVSWAVRETGCAGGVVITASHNSALFNGFKIKAPWGGSAFPETTAAVESLLDANPPARRALTVSYAEGIGESIESYRRQVANYVDLDQIKGSRAHVVIDPMHGSGGNWVENFLKGNALTSETIRSHRDPLFGGVAPEPIDRNLGALKQRVRETSALVGLATDGDADRVGAVSDTGSTMTMHEVVPLILLHLVRRRGLSGGIVRTFSQSVLLRRIAAAHGIPLYETPIGFKYVAELMQKTDVLIGAEESGGIGVRDHIPERDGILNSLLFLEAITSAGKKPSEMVLEMHREFGEFYFGRRDHQLPVARGMALVEQLAANPPAIISESRVASVETMDGTKLVFDDDSWLLFRQSGTEPVLRIYAEATSVAMMEGLLEAGSQLALAD